MTNHQDERMEGLDDYLLNIASDALKAHPAMKRLYRALGGIPERAPASGVGDRVTSHSKGGGDA